MLLALMLVATAPNWVPMRWNSADPKSLELLRGTPINCLLLERGNWSPALLNAASQAGLATVGVVRPGSDAVNNASQAAAAKLNAVVLEGDFEPAAAARIRNLLSDSRVLGIELSPRSRIRLESNDPVIGTYQGVWPGIQIEEKGSTKSAPSGAPWIDTNTGFLRFLRAASGASIWIGNTPPKQLAVTAERYMQAVSDAAISGGRWVLALDNDFEQRLYAKNADAIKDWKRIAAQVAYYESHKEWSGMQPLALLALVQDVDSGALLSGGILDMIAVKHTPVRPVPTRKLSDPEMSGSKMAVDVNPAVLTPEQKAVLQRFTRAGGTLLTAPPDWKFPALKPNQITLGDEDIKILDDIWKELNTMTGRRNLGARLFNVSSMLSNLLQTSDGKMTILHLVNYSGYPVENVTLHMLGKYRTAKLYSPDAPARDVAPYEVEEGTGFDIDKVGVSATLVFE